MQQQWLTDSRLPEAACLAADDPTRCTPEEATSLPGPQRGRHDPPGRETHETACPSPATSSSSTRCSSRPSRTTSTPTGRASPSSCSGCARTPVTVGTTGGWRSSRGRTVELLAAGAVVSTVLAPPRRRPRGQLHRVHRRPPSGPRPRCREVAAPHRDRRRCAARTGPGGPRGGLGLTDRCRRSLLLDGLGDRLRPRVVVQGARVRRHVCLS